jgi:hypothetical protein
MSAAQETEFRSLIADVDFSNQAANQATFVAVGPAVNGQGYDQGNAAMQKWTDGKRAYGVLLTAPAQGEAGTIRIRGLEQVRCGAAFNAGDLVAPMAGGLASPTTDATKARGQARNSAVVGDLAMVELF